MFLPRSSLQLAALCITLFSSLAWFLNASSGGDVFQQRGSNSYLRYGSSNRVLPPLVTDVRPLVGIDEPANDPIWDIANRTLGFQKIYAISMAHRIDKRDYLALMALVSDLEIEFADGVNASEMHPKAFPAYWKGNEVMGDYGCWRAHIDVYQDMVQNRIQSALIIEDDTDWDMLLRPQLVEFARGVRALQNATLPLHSPYGDNWDLFPFGHNGANNWVFEEKKYWVTENDPTVIAEERRTYGRKPDLSAEKLGGDHTRIIMEMAKFTSTAAYGISLRGAARLLYDQSMLPNANAIDVAMLNLCRHNPYGSPFCMGTYPMLFGRYRAIGPQDRDSDRRAASNEAKKGAGGHQSSEDRLEPESEFTVFPVSLNIGRMMQNEWVIPANKPDSDLVKEVDLRTFRFPRGRAVVVKPEEYVDTQARIAAEKAKKEARQE